MEATNFSDENNSRFRVYREGNVLSLLGCISDTPDLHALDGLLVDGVECDFSKITFASWIGLATLGNYIFERKFSVTIKSVPFQVYDSMRMMKYFSEQVITSAELPLLNLQTGKVRFATLELDQFRDKVMDGEDWIEVLPNERLLVPSRYLLSDISFLRSSGPVANNVDPDCTEMISFWMQYSIYCQSTLDISAILVNASKFNIIEFVNEIKAKVQAGENALKLIDPRSKYTLVDRMNKMIKDSEESFASLSGVIVEKLSESVESLGQLILSGTHENKEVEAFTEIVANHAKLVESFVSVAEKCEDCGVAIGGHLGSLRATQVLKNGLSTLSNPSSELLNGIRESFAIMDIMSEDDWPATRELIEEELEQIDYLIGRCIVSLQGFDMMRQILEHRIHEMKLVVETFNNDGPFGLLDAGLKEAVLNEIGSHLVTEQEKTAFEFYLPDAYQQVSNTDRIEPGDVLLF